MSEEYKSYPSLYSFPPSSNTSVLFPVIDGLNTRNFPGPCICGPDDATESRDCGHGSCFTCRDFVCCFCISCPICIEPITSDHLPGGVVNLHDDDLVPHYLHEDCFTQFEASGLVMCPYPGCQREVRGIDFRSFLPQPSFPPIPVLEQTVAAAPPSYYGIDGEVPGWSQVQIIGDLKDNHSNFIEGAGRRALHLSEFRNYTYRTFKWYCSFLEGSVPAFDFLTERRDVILPVVMVDELLLWWQGKEITNEIYGESISRCVSLTSNINCIATTRLLEMIVELPKVGMFLYSRQLGNSWFTKCLLRMVFSRWRGFALICCFIYLLNRLRRIRSIRSC